MLIGFFLRRIITLTLCAGAFWLGIRTDQMMRPEPAAASVAADCTEPGNGN